MDERWKDVPGFPGYEASDHGRIRSWHKTGKGSGRGWLDVPRVLVPWAQKSGHLNVTLCRDRQRFNRCVHRLVLLSFVGPCPPGMECRHRDGNPANNRPDNLSWGTHRDNEADKREHGTVPIGERHGGAKLTPADVLEIRKMYADMVANQYELARLFWVSQGQIGRIIRWENWANLPDTVGQSRT